MEPKSRYKPGDMIGEVYQVDKVLVGGFSEIYLCRQMPGFIDLPAVLKTLRKEYLSQSVLDTLYKEVAIWVTLGNHANIVKCFGIQELDNHPFITLEWIFGDRNYGTSLRDWLQHGPLELPLSLKFTMDICRGLRYAQQQIPGIVHQDLKPENVLVNKDHVALITDFGLATVVQKLDINPEQREDEAKFSLSLQSEGGIVGTPAYMAPEQWRGEKLDARTDIYAIGCILFELISGTRPYSATTNYGFSKQHMLAPIPSLPHVLPTINRLLERCLAKEPAERFATVDALLFEIERLHHQLYDQPLQEPSTVNSEFTVWSYLLRVETYMKTQQYDAAINDLTKAIELTPIKSEYSSQLASAYSKRATANYYQKKYEQAVSDLTRAIEFDPSPGDYNNRGTIHREQGDYVSALQDFNMAIELDPELAAAYSNRGLTYNNMGRNKEALVDLARSIELDPGSALAYINRGNVYAEMGQEEMALVDFTASIKLDPKNAQCYYERGVSYKELGKNEEAISDFRYAVDIDPTYANAHYNLGYMLATSLVEEDLGDPEEVIYHLGQAAKFGARSTAQHADALRKSVKEEFGNPSQRAFNAFHRTNSLEDMYKVVEKFPFMLESGFIETVERTINQGVPRDEQPPFRVRLAWLYQIVSDQGQ